MLCGEKKNRQKLTLRHTITIKFLTDLQLPVSCVGHSLLHICGHTDKVGHNLNRMDQTLAQNQLDNLEGSETYRYIVVDKAL